MVGARSTGIHGTPEPIACRRPFSRESNQLPNTVEVLTWTGLTRFYVLFVTAFETRRVEIAGIIRQPDGAWMLQVARNLIDSVDGFLAGTRFLLLARDRSTRPSSGPSSPPPGSHPSACHQAVPT
jgi:hypothetical protein